jgi:hypothetical protein
MLTLIAGSSGLRLECAKQLLVVDQALLKRLLLVRVHRRQPQVTQLRIGQRRRVRRLLQELLLELVVLARLRLPLLLLQVPDLLLLKELELHSGVRCARNREQKADEEQPPQHSGHREAGNPALLVVAMVPPNIKRRGDSAVRASVKVRSAENARLRRMSHCLAERL